jgi:hypothetical protein
LPKGYEEESPALLLLLAIAAAVAAEDLVWIRPAVVAGNPATKIVDSNTHITDERLERRGSWQAPDASAAFQRSS